MSSIRGYKWAVAPTGARVIVTLEVPLSARHNIGREKILDPKMASYVTDRAHVVSIVDEEGNSVPQALSNRWPERLRYVVGQDVSEPNYNWPEGPKGIHFYGCLERLPFCFNINNGLNKIYGENGWMTMEYQMHDGIIDETTMKVHTRYDPEDEEDKADFIINPFKIKA